jgi:hypothetical protein
MSMRSTHVGAIRFLAVMVGAALFFCQAVGPFCVMPPPPGSAHEEGHEPTAMDPMGQAGDCATSLPSSFFSILKVFPDSCSSLAPAFYSLTFANHRLVTGEVDAPARPMPAVPLYAGLSTLRI